MYEMTDSEKAEVRDGVRTWDWQTNEEKEKARAKAVRSAASDLHSFLRNNLAVQWQAFGVDILLETDIFASQAERGRVRTTEALREAIDDHLKGWDEDSQAAWQSEVLRVMAWMDVSPYRIWTLYKAIREDVIYELDDRMFSLAAGSDGFDVSKLLQTKWDEAVRAWANNLDKG